MSGDEGFDEVSKVVTDIWDQELGILTPEEQYASLTIGFGHLLTGMMLMPVSDELRGKALSLVADTMQNLTRLVKMMFKEEVDEATEEIST